MFDAPIWMYSLGVLGIWTRAVIAILDYRDRHKEE